MSHSGSAESSSSVISNSRCSVFPGHVTRVDRVDKSLSCDTTSSRQNLVSSQSCVNPLSEIRSRRRSVPLQRGSSDSCVSDQLELVHLHSSPVASHGHRFISANLSQPTWCDKCGDFIWGVYKQCLICTSMLALFFLLLVVRLSQYFCHNHLQKHLLTVCTFLSDVILMLSAAVPGFNLEFHHLH